MIQNPYRRHAGTLTNSASHMFLITPNDEQELLRVCKAIRIWNPSQDNPATVRFETIDGSDVTVTVPPLSVWTEPAIVKKVFETNTTDAVIIHGYSD